MSLVKFLTTCEYNTLNLKSTILFEIIFGKYTPKDFETRCIIKWTEKLTLQMIMMMIRRIYYITSDNNKQDYHRCDLFDIHHNHVIKPQSNKRNFKMFLVYTRFTV